MARVFFIDKINTIVYNDSEESENKNHQNKNDNSCDSKSIQKSTSEINQKGPTAYWGENDLSKIDKSFYTNSMSFKDEAILDLVAGSDDLREKSLISFNKERLPHSLLLS